MLPLPLLQPKAASERVERRGRTQANGNGNTRRRNSNGNQLHVDKQSAANEPDRRVGARQRLGESERGALSRRCLRVGPALLKAFALAKRLRVPASVCVCVCDVLGAYYGVLCG